MASTFYSSEASSLEKTVDIEDNSIDLNLIWNEKHQQLCKEWLVDNGYQRVCLQFPDDYLKHSTKISDYLKSVSDAKFFILADTSYGSCCVDELAAFHADADSIIHFGPTCKSKTSAFPVLYIFPHFPFDWDQFRKHLSAHYDEDSEVHCFFDLPYQYLIGEDWKMEIDKLGFKIKEFHVRDTFDLKYEETSEFKDKKCLFVGQDNQSFFNLTLSARECSWLMYDPIKETFGVIEPKSTNWFQRRYYYIEKCKDAQMLGLVVATLTASGYLTVIRHIQEMAWTRGIRTHIISVGRLNTAKLANFMEIDCFVLIGCPFNDLHTSREFYKPIVSVLEAELALNPIWGIQIPEKFCTDMTAILPGGEMYHEFVPENIKDGDMSLVSGRLRQKQQTNDCKGKGNGALVERKKYQLMEKNGGTALEDRSWKGLDPALGQTAPAKMQTGRTGLPTNYK